MYKLYATAFLVLLHLTFTGTQAQNFESSNLPIVVINTEGKTIVDEPKVNVKMGIIDNGTGNRNYYKNPFNNNLPDPFNSFDGTVGIELRGSASQFFPKKPYGFETRDGTDKSINVPILGMPTESDWILNASYTDKSLMRDVLTYHLSNQMGRYASRTKYVELVLDGDYRGVYIMMEKIKRDVNRIDIASLKPTDTDGDAITGGYILKIDKNTGTSNASWLSPHLANHGMEINVMVEYPKKEVLTDGQYNYIKNHFTEFENVLKSTNFKDPTNGYAKYIDVNSFIDYFLLTELNYNIDAFRLSIFFYKDRDSRNSKIKMGAPWDYDHAYGNANFCHGWETNHWAYDFIREFCPSEDKQVPFWWARLLEDRDFCIKVRDRWQQLRQNQWSTGNITSFIDQNATLLNESQVRNFQRWPILGEWVWPNYYYGNTYQEEVNWFKNWTQQRLNWVDANISQIGALGKVIDCANVAKPGVTSPVNYCQGQISTQLTATGTELKWYNFQTDGVGSSTAPTPVTVSLGTTSYFVSQTINGCESERAQIDVSVSSKPSAPSANNIEYCQGQTASPLSASGANLQWYTSPSGGTGTTASPTPSTSSPNLLSYFVSQTVNGCESNRTQINVSIKIRPDKPQATLALNYCQELTSAPLSASGINLKWYNTASGGVGEATAPTPSTASSGLFSYFVSQTIGGCESDRAKIDVTINSKPTAPTANNAEYCQGQTAGQLSANGSNLKWYSGSVGGTGDFNAPIPTTSSAGLLSYFVSQTINSCESNRTQLTVNIKSKSDKPQATSALGYCAGQTATPLTANGTNLQWYSTLTGGLGSDTAPTPSTISTGLFSYFVSQTPNGCESDRAKIDVTINSKPAAPSASNVDYCQGQTTVSLSANGTNLQWYTLPNGGTGTPIAPTPPTITATLSSYFVSQTVNGCESNRTQINVNVKIKPDKPQVTSALSYCQGQTAAPLSVSGTSLKWYTSLIGGTGTGVVPTPATSLAGLSSYFVSQTLNGCESDRAKIDVTIKSKPTAPSVNNIEYCQSQTALSLTASGTNLQWYTVLNGGAGSNIAPTPSTTNATTLSHFVTQTVNGCESNRAKIDVTVKAKPAKPLVTAVITYTQGQAPAVLTAVGSGIKWYTSATGGTANTVAPTPSTSTVGTSNYFVNQTVNNCESDRAQISIQVSAPTAATVCLEVKVLLEGAMSGTTMSTKLNQQGLLPGQLPLSALAVATPTGQPYKSAPWNYNGTESSSIYAADVVDWVLLSLRTAPQEATTTVYRTAALLHKDGKITAIANCPVLNPTQSFFVAVEHRNHIGAVSHDAVPIVKNKITYDFTQRQSYIPAGLPASGQLQVGATYCLYASDAQKASFSEINANDATMWLIDNGKFGRYTFSDFNLDGEINASDATIWRRNNGKFSGVQF
ncbi:CotH kinase family protein [Runella sp.]|uniref:Ig-like domain-containing protein n=1 Tax=Runella sp. TaxID=1960881 RepID=UPI002607804D|nr:CotH kinase family protein [Runella sp.]